MNIGEDCLKPMSIFMNRAKAGAILLLLALMCVGTTAQADIKPEPYPPDALLQGVLDFREPTGIRGRLLHIDREKQIIWLEWAQVSVDSPLFQKEWERVPNEWIIAVHPLNQSQFYILTQMAKGTALEMVIQLDQEGCRCILSFQELPLLPKVGSTFSLP